MSLTNTWVDLYGDAYWYVVKDSSGTPIEIHILDPKRVTVLVDKNMTEVKGYAYKRMKKGGEEDIVLFVPEEVVHFTNPSITNRFMGESPLAALATPVKKLALSNRLEISVKGADFSSKVKLRESIRDTLFEKFCLINHSVRLNRLRKILKLNKDNLETAEPVKWQKIEDLTRLIIKHVAIRNCLEHADSKVRQRDINSAGYSQNIPMLKADGTICEYEEGDVISISDKDILELNKMIIDYMNYFEVEL